jgi:hypothetical protein
VVLIFASALFGHLDFFTKAAEWKIKNEYKKIGKVGQAEKGSLLIWDFST